MYKKCLLPDEAVRPKEYIIKVIVFFLLIILTIIQQMPIVKDLYYEQIRFSLYLGFGIFSFLSMFSLPNLMRDNFVKYYLLCIIYSTILIVIKKIAENTQVISGIFELLVPFGILLCSLKTPFNKKWCKNLLTTYIFLSAILGISSIFYYGEGFTILENYFLDQKNQIGPLLGISAVITIDKISKMNAQMDKNKKKIATVLDILLFTVIISSMAVMRNRSGLVGIVIIILLYIKRECKIELNLKNIIIIHFSLLILIILFITGALENLFQTVKDVFMSNYGSTDLNSISAGRIIVYKSAIIYTLKHPIIGELGTTDKFYDIPHNYILNKWVRYGIIGSLPLIIFYFFLWFFALTELKKSRKKSQSNTLSLWVLLFSLVVSMFEYTYPFGPGTSQIMVWFLLGQYLEVEVANEQQNKVSS